MGCSDRAFESQMNNWTWVLTNLPVGLRALKCKWVYKLKINFDGLVQRYKARLVVKGCSQVRGVDLNESYFPVVRYACFHYMLASTAQMGLPVYQMDAETPFL